MAKRGYRGKHPHNDMKVSPNPSSTKYSAKLTTEYNNLPAKQKYPFIRTNYIYPVGVGTITISGNVADEKTITVISTDGTSVAYLAGGSENLASTPAPTFKRNGGDNDVIATSIKDCINTGHSGKILATVDGAVVTLTQLEPGPDGNTTITEDDSSVAVTNFTGG